VGLLVAVVVVVLLAAPAAVVWGAPRRDALAVRRRAESHAPLLTASLVPSHRAVAGRPPAASTARQVYRITDLPAAQPRARGEWKEPV
jgi:hypothetical protein